MVRKKGRKRGEFYCCSKLLQHSYFSLSEPGNYWYYYNTSTGTTQWEHPVDTVIRRKLSQAREHPVDTSNDQQLEHHSEHFVIKQKQTIEKDHPVVIEDRVASICEQTVLINQKTENSTADTIIKREQDLENEGGSKYLVISIHCVTSGTLCNIW